MRDSSVKWWSRLHATVFRSSGGRLGRRLVGNDMLLLTTTGRSSRRPHRVPLLYLTDGERLVVVASYGGRDRHPDWYRNLDANPIVEVQTPHWQSVMQARTADAAERSAWWPRILTAYAGYRIYQERTDREIPVVFLEPLK